LNKLRFE